MRFPWVSAALHDEMMTIVQSENARLQRQLADLSGKYHQLRLSGAVEHVDVPRDTPERDPVTMAINRRAGGNGQLRTMMLVQARMDRAAGKTDDDILRAIEDGVSVDGLPS